MRFLVGLKDPSIVKGAKLTPTLASVLCAITQLSGWHPSLLPTLIMSDIKCIQIGINRADKNLPIGN